jgi:hypothetical protein
MVKPDDGIEIGIEIELTNSSIQQLIDGEASPMNGLGR